MRNLLLFSVGALALAGCDFAGGSSGAAAPIASLQAANLPAATGATADLFFEIQDATGRAYYRSAIQSGASTVSLTDTVTETISIPSSAAPMYVAVYDFESSFHTSDLLARSAAFTGADLAAAAQITRDDAPFMSSAPNEATFTITRSTATQ